ncbi:MAG: C40 family peptidase, partial [Bacteroidales bacterium]|nr:C40 family peptidase [Bacteroidales bacterium]
QLPRDSDQQSRCGRVITEDFDPAGLETGDLLFFGNRATDTSPERVSHVAMYLGGGEFIHAAGYRDRVGINSMDSTRPNFIPDYPERFIRATRIIGEESEGFQPIAENSFYREIIKRAE